MKKYFILQKISLNSSHRRRKFHVWKSFALLSQQPVDHHGSHDLMILSYTKKSFKSKLQVDLIFVKQQPIKCFQYKDVQNLATLKCDCGKITTHTNRDEVKCSNAS